MHREKSVDAVTLPKLACQGAGRRRRGLGQWAGPRAHRLGAAVADDGRRARVPGCARRSRRLSGRAVRAAALLRGARVVFLGRSSAAHLPLLGRSWRPFGCDAQSAPFLAHRSRRTGDLPGRRTGLSVGDRGPTTLPEGLYKPTTAFASTWSAGDFYPLFVRKIEHPHVLEPDPRADVPCVVMLRV